MEQQQDISATPTSLWAGWRCIEEHTGRSAPTLRKLGAPTFKLGGATCMTATDWARFVDQHRGA